MVKEIIKRARDPVKSRTINTDVVDKYKKKLAKLEEDIKRVLEEETAEREIAKLENRAGKMQNRINGQEDDRVWFQTKQQRLEEKRKLKEKLKDPTNTKRKMRKQKAALALPQDPEEAKAFKEGNREYDYVNREAKRKRKLSKITVFNEDDDVGVGSKKKRGKKSSFDRELVNTSAKSVKAFRHVANQKKNEDRRNSKKKGGKNKSSFK